MKKPILLVLLVATLALLVLSNPGEASFEAWVKDRVEDRVAEEAGDGALGRVLTDMGSSVVGGLASRAAVRSNWMLFSVYTIDLGLDGQEGGRWRFVGAVGTFVEIESPGSSR